MGIFEKLEKIREKPAAAKKIILALTLFFSMVFVIGLWLSLLKFGNLSASNPRDSGPRPWAVIRETFESSKEEFKKVLPPGAEIYLSE